MHLHKEVVQKDNALDISHELISFNPHTSMK